MVQRDHHSCGRRGFTETMNENGNYFREPDLMLNIRIFQLKKELHFDFSSSHLEYYVLIITMPAQLAFELRSIMSYRFCVF